MRAQARESASEVARLALPLDLRVLAALGGELGAERNVLRLQRLDGLEYLLPALVAGPEEPAPAGGEDRARKRGDPREVGDPGPHRFSLALDERVLLLGVSERNLPWRSAGLHVAPSFPRSWRWVRGPDYPAARRAVWHIYTRVVEAGLSPS